MLEPIPVYITNPQGGYLRTDYLDPKGPQPLHASYVAPPDAEEGFTRVWTGATWEQVPDEEVPGLPWPPGSLVYPQFTALEVLDLFTGAEQLAIVAATMVEPAVKLWYDRLIAATFVTYEDPRTEEGLQALVDAGLLTPQRKAEIVAAMQPEGIEA